MSQPRQNGSLNCVRIPSKSCRLLILSTSCKAAPMPKLNDQPILKSWPLHGSDQKKRMAALTLFVLREMSSSMEQHDMQCDEQY